MNSVALDKRMRQTASRSAVDTEMAVEGRQYAHLGHAGGGSGTLSTGRQRPVNCVTLGKPQRIAAPIPKSHAASGNRTRWFASSGPETAKGVSIVRAIPRAVANPSARKNTQANVTARNVTAPDRSVRATDRFPA